MLLKADGQGAYSEVMIIHILGSFHLTPKQVTQLGENNFQIKNLKLFINVNVPYSNSEEKS